MSEPEDEPAAAGRRSRLLFLPVLAFAALALLFLARLLSGADPARVPSVLVGRPAPALALPAVEGLARPGLTSGEMKGGVTVVNVWASWCAPCRVEHPQLMALAGDGVRVVGIDYKDEPENARRFLGLLGNPFAAVGADRDGRAAIEWGVYGVPETFVVGPDGTIRHKLVGPLTAETMPAFREALKAAR